MTERQRHDTILGTFLRTGKWIPAQLRDARLEVKFNPWHDPDDGRFTFVGQGRFYGSESERSRSGQGTPRRRPATSPRSATTSFSRHDPRHQANHSVYVVRRGDTLEHIAATRVGLRPADLIWLNGLTSDRLLIGQQVKVPHQVYLDRGKRALDTSVALELYMGTHDGRLPPNVARPPSVFEQIYGPGSRHVERNGYVFDIDPQGRTRNVAGVIHLNPDQGRSRANQAAAGRPDRLPTDDGGHYIARRFDGPTDAFNHFAQDANFNKGLYRALENRWAAAATRGEKVRVVVSSEYDAGSRRPARLVVSWTLAGRTRIRRFRNSRRIVK